MKNDIHDVSVVVHNRHSHLLFLVVEPWGDEFEMEPESELRVVFSAPLPARIPISYKPDSIVVECLGESVVTVWNGDKRLF